MQFVERIAAARRTRRPTRGCRWSTSMAFRPAAAATGTLPTVPNLALVLVILYAAAILALARGRPSGGGMDYLLAGRRLTLPAFVATLVTTWYGGILGVGEVSVIVAVAAGHRGEAFEAARFLIDEVKAHAPIWKKEHWEGGAEWVQGA